MKLPHKPFLPDSLYRSLQISHAQDMGIEAAKSGDTVNPFRDLGLAAQWDSTRRAELVRQAAARGKLAEAESELDAADPQPDSWLSRLMSFVLGPKGVQ